VGSVNLKIIFLLLLVGMRIRDKKISRHRTSSQRGEARSIVQSCQFLLVGMNLSLGSVAVTGRELHRVGFRCTKSYLAMKPGSDVNML
jgi:hypothetical protein